MSRFADMPMPEAWEWLHEHPLFQDEHGVISALDVNLDVHYTYVCPATDSVEKDPSLNTQVQVWVEFGPIREIEGHTAIGVFPGGKVYDPDLNVGGDTFELAFKVLCEAVLEQYGDYDPNAYEASPEVEAMMKEWQETWAKHKRESDPPAPSETEEGQSGEEE